VLIVDDSRAIRQILSRTLVDAGYRVLHAGNGREGVDVARAEMPDLILLDIDMPVLDGLGAMREIKADPLLDTIPVLFLTARTSGSDAAEGLGLGAQDYLRKPCEPAELLARVGTAARLHQQRQDLQAQTQRLGNLSTTDPLTGLGNRRRFEIKVEELAAEAAAELPVGIVILDLDRFKAINDTRGHLVGDTVLTLLARRIRSAARDDDTVVRWGGEEFLVLREGQGAADLGETAEAMRSAADAGPLAVGVDELVHVTLSAGWSIGTIGHLNDVIKAADDALYWAKEHGRNRVVGPTLQ
jgi:diguanylate cyclase (GGDEF)-like protein